MQVDTLSVELTQDLQQVEEEIDRFGGRRFAVPRFCPPLEEQFQRELHAERVYQVKTRGLISLAIFDLFLVGDYLMSPEHLLRAVVVRFGLVTPLALLLIWMLRWKHRPAMREATTGMLCFVICCCGLYLHHGTGVLGTVQAEGGVFLVLLTLNTALQVDVLYAGIATSLCFAADLCFVWANSTLTGPQKLNIGGRVFWLTLFTLFANLVITRERRTSWLLRLRGKVQRSMLADVNARLVSLSETDRLTGLANRHAYDHRLASMWQNAAGKGTPLSAIMVDVDHFKSINDDFGHAYGDRILQRVAALLQQSLREEDDFVARIGGEEFIVLLPSSDAASAALVAERIRTLVQVAGSPAITGNKPVAVANMRWSTVSCGVATTVPTRSAEPQTLIEAADAALYRAKQTGRNRVCSANREERPEGRIAIVKRAY